MPAHAHPVEGDSHDNVAFILQSLKILYSLFETLRNEGLALDDLDAVLSTFIRVPN